MTTKAYSYIRFSTKDQMKGDSLRRQIELSREYAKKHNLVLDETLNMHDLGVSAFRGSNLDSGALGAFISAVDNGKIARGSYLLVENLDRLSRNTVRQALKLFLSIIDKGIIIITLNDGMKYDQNADMQELIISLTIMSRAHNESVTKSKRITAAWEKKISRAEVKLVTKWIPAWLRINEKNKIEVIPERGKLVKQIYKWCLDGNGMRLIMQKIDALDIAPWGASTSIALGDDTARNRKPVKWHMSYINRILTNRAVLGEYQPRKTSKEGNVIKNYFPRVIDDQIFYRVQEIRKQRNVNTGQGTGPRGESVSNLFTGLLKCGYSLDSDVKTHRCAGNSSSVTFVNKGPRSVTKYLQCTRLKEGNLGCEGCQKLWRYQDFETSFLTHVKDIDYSVLLGEQSNYGAQIMQSGLEISKQKIQVRMFHFLLFATNQHSTEL